MISKQQIQLIHIAAKAAGLNDAQYRMLLQNVAHVKSCKELDQAAFEDVLALLEESGFVDAKHGIGYWKAKVDARGGRANERMVWKIRQLAEPSRYNLATLVERFSNNRTERVEDLTPREAWNLIEMLKASGRRESDRQSLFQPRLAVGAQHHPGAQP